VIVRGDTIIQNGRRIDDVEVAYAIPDWAFREMRKAKAAVATL
jgi:hypothetical protein